MYGLPNDLNLGAIQGLLVAQICLGPHDIQIRLDPEGCISVQGKLALLSEDGVEIESGEPADLVGSTRLGCLLNRKIESTVARSAKDLEIRFEAGFRLVLSDSSEQFESFQIEPGGLIV